MNEENKSLVRRLVEGNRNFRRYMKLTQVVVCIVIFIVGLIISNLLLVNLEKSDIITALIISSILTIITLVPSFTIEPRSIFGFTALSSILVGSIIMVI